MPLPKIQHPTYNVKLFSREQPITIRPFLVKEHKILMMAAESGDTKTIMKSVKQIINNCIQEEDVDVDDLPTIDLETLFVNLRSRSIGEVIELKYKCRTNIAEGVECGNPFTLPINLLSDLSIKNEKTNFKIPLTETIGIMMKLPSSGDVEDFLKLAEQQSSENEFAMAAACIDFIYDSEGIYYSSEAKKEELVDFLSDMTKDQFAQLEEFFNSMPYLYAEKQIQCKKCGTNHLIKLEGIADFFS